MNTAYVANSTNFKVAHASCLSKQEKSKLTHVPCFKTCLLSLGNNTRRKSLSENGKACTSIDVDSDFEWDITLSPKMPITPPSMVGIIDSLSYLDLTSMIRVEKKSGN